MHSVASVCLSVCLYVSTLTWKQLELSTPNLAHVYSIAVARHALTQRSKGQRWRSHGYEKRHVRMVASDACCNGLCCRGYTCRFDCLCFLVVFVFLTSLGYDTVLEKSCNYLWVREWEPCMQYASGQYFVTSMYKVIIVLCCIVLCCLPSQICEHGDVKKIGSRLMSIKNVALHSTVGITTSSVPSSQKCFIVKFSSEFVMKPSLKFPPPCPKRVATLPCKNILQLRIRVASDAVILCHSVALHGCRWQFFCSIWKRLICV